MVSLKRLNSFTRKKKKEEGRTFQVLGTACAKTLWRGMTDVKVSAAGAEWERKRRPDSVGPRQGVPDLCLKSSGNHEKVLYWAE